MRGNTLISTRQTIAARAVIELAKMNKPTPVSLSRVARALDISLSYLEQIFADLRKAEIVKSFRGPGGGYVLAKPATEITMDMIFTAVKREPVELGEGKERDFWGTLVNAVHVQASRTPLSVLAA